MNTPPRRFLAPEVVQTSAMDCGPAALKSLLEGFGIPASYGRLREACQTDVDGTSIDTLEEIARSLGLDAEQVMLPPDHLLLPEAAALPAVVVVSLAPGADPFRRGLAAAWRLGTGDGPRRRSALAEAGAPFTRPLHPPHAGACRRLARLGALRRLSCPAGPPTARPRAGDRAPGWLAESAQAPAWQDLAALDAATRLAAVLVRGQGIKPGPEAGRVLHSLWRRAAANPDDARRLIPEAYWSAHPLPPDDDAEPASLLLTGAVLIRVRGLRAAATAETEEDAPPPLGAELAAALAEAPARPLSDLWGLACGDGVWSLAALGGGLLPAALGVVLEALLLRGALDLGQDLSLVPQRLAASGYFLLLVLALLWLELGVTGALLRLGRRLETRLRLAVLERIVRLPDQYFRSRPVSDMAERGHAVHTLGRLPPLAGQWLRACLTLIVTAAAIAWLDPGGAPIALLAALLGIGLPLAFNPGLQELDLRARTHNGALMRFYLDTLLGLRAIRAHGGEASIGREQEDLLVEWGAARLQLFRTQWLLEGLQATAGFGLAAWLLFDYAAAVRDPAGALLLAYWALSIPTPGEEIALLARQWPAHRNMSLRLLEPLHAPVDWDAAPPVAAPVVTARGLNIGLEDVAVKAGGHPLLRAIDLQVAAGEHVAIVGPSGAGKSSLVGLLLGWYRAAAGVVRIDGEPPDSARLDLLRHELVWIDPAVRLWNRPLLDNLAYGTPGDADWSWVLNAAELLGVVESLPDGLLTVLGEGGGRLSGGEGQRVRVGRGLRRAKPRLVILDEPFRGLERPLRHALLERVRAHWRDATLLCVTHDLSETLAFERVLVLDGGCLVEDGDPRALLEDPDSLYRALHDAEIHAHEEIWGDPRWRRVRLDGGRAQEASETGG